VTLLISSNLARAEEFIQVKGLYWNAVLDGKVQADTALINGTNIDFQNDLHTDRISQIPTLEFRLNLLKAYQFTGSYWKTAYAGSKTLTKNISYNGKNYALGEKLTTDIDISVGSLLYEKSFIPESVSGAFPTVAQAQFGIRAGLEYISTKCQILSSTTHVNSDQDAALPIPVLGLFTQIGVFKELVSVDAGINGFGGTISDYSFKFIDAYIELKVKALKLIPVGIGYKFVNLKIESDVDNVFFTDLTLDGAYIFASMGF
jgi:hypothetical protein